DAVSAIVAGLCHAAGNRPRANDAEEDGAPAPGGGFDAQFGPGGWVATSPGGANVPVRQRGPGGFGGLKVRHIEPGGLKELVPIEGRRGWSRLFHLWRDGFERQQLAIGIGFET